MATTHDPHLQDQESTARPASKPVLLAEDEQLDVFLMKRAFHLAEIANPLVAVPDGHEAIYYLQGRGHYMDRRQYPEPCLALLDLKLPLVDGFGVLRWIRQQPAWQESLPVIILSSSDQETDIRKAFELGAHEYLVKPGNFKELLAMVYTLKHDWLGPSRKAKAEKLKS
jgi:DNA-binding response OmpR family regulator